MQVGRFGAVFSPLVFLFITSIENILRLSSPLIFLLTVINKLADSKYCIIPNVTLSLFFLLRIGTTTRPTTIEYVHFAWPSWGWETEPRRTLCHSRPRDKRRTIMQERRIKQYQHWMAQFLCLFWSKGRLTKCFFCGQR